MTNADERWKDPAQIEEYGRRLIGSTLRKTPGINAIPADLLDATTGAGTKGDFGTMVERYYYGITPSNLACTPDFRQASVELKTNSLVERKNGLSSKERLVLEMISYHDVINESFETSCFLRKSRLMMLISNTFRKGTRFVDSKIVFVKLIDFDSLPEVDKRIIEQDWTTIVRKVRSGHAHHLSGSDTKYLEACTKGRDGSHKVSQPNSDVQASPRAFALKSGYVSSLIRSHLGGDEGLAITDPSLVEAYGFEASIIDRFEPYIGKDVEQIRSMLGVSADRESKDYRALLARAIMGVQERKVAEFERANIAMKTVTIQKNGIPREHMSFPAFRYLGESSILEESWDALEDDNAPAFKTLLLEKRFLFVVFEEDAGRQVLRNVRFWSMPPEDVENFVRPVWQATFEAINTGNIHDLPGQSFNDVCHVRPHARNAADTLPTPHNGDQVKKCFWLDRRYIAKNIESP